MPAFTDGTILDPFQPPLQEPATSLVNSVFTVPAACEPCRIESAFTIQINGKLYKFVMRDKIVPEDPFLIALKAAAFSIARAEEYRGTPPPRTIRDFLVKQNVTI